MAPTSDTAADGGQAAPHGSVAHHVNAVKSAAVVLADPMDVGLYPPPGPGPGGGGVLSDVPPLAPSTVPAAATASYNPALMNSAAAAAPALPPPYVPHKVGSTFLVNAAQISPPAPPANALPLSMDLPPSTFNYMSAYPLTDPSSSFTHTFLRGILTSIDSKDPVVANAWLETLLDAIDLLPADVVKREIIIIAVSKGQLAQSTTSRKSSARLLGKISPQLAVVL